MNETVQLCWIGNIAGIEGLRFVCPHCEAAGFVAPVPLAPVTGQCLGCFRELTLAPVEGHA